MLYITTGRMMINFGVNVGVNFGVFLNSGKYTDKQKYQLNYR